MKNINYESKFDKSLRKHFEKISNDYSKHFKVGDKVVHIMGDYVGIIKSINNNRFSIQIVSIGDNCISSSSKIGDIIKNLPLDSYKLV